MKESVRQAGSAKNQAKQYTVDIQRVVQNMQGSYTIRQHGTKLGGNRMVKDTSNGQLRYIRASVKASYPIQQTGIRHRKCCLFKFCSDWGLSVSGWEVKPESLRWKQPVQLIK